MITGVVSVAPITIIDVSTPATPTFVGHIAGAGSPNFLASAQSVAVLGKYAYVAAYAPDNSLSIFDVSTPSAPSFVGNIQSGATGGAPYFMGTPNYAFVFANRAFVAAETDSSIVLIDVSAPASPKFVANLAGTGTGPPYFLTSPVWVTVVGSYVYVAASADQALTILQLIDAPTSSGPPDGVIPVFQEYSICV